MMNTTRREFLTRVAAGAAGALLAGSGLAAKATTDATGIVKLGGKLRVPLIGMGTGVKGMNRSSKLVRMGREAAEACVAHAYDAGVRLFDQADLYGTHALVADILKDKPRDSYVLSSKVWLHKKGIKDYAPEDADVAVKRFLEECKTDYIDLVQIHCMTRLDWTKTFRKQMDLLEKCREEGLIKAHGCSCHHVNGLAAAAEDAWIDVVHARINPYGIMMDGPPEKVVPVLKKVHAAGKGVIGMKLVGEGRYGADSEKLQKAVDYVVGLDCVDAVVVGFEKPAEIDDIKRRVQKALAAKV